MDHTKITGLIPPPQLSWELGTAYDLFVSLAVLQLPERFGLRASWAAGVRSRLPAAERRVMEETYPFLWVPLAWIHRLPAPRDAASALWALRQVPLQERLSVLALGRKQPPGVEERLHAVAVRHSWDESDLEALRAAYRGHARALSAKDLSSFLDWWVRPQEFGELFLSALTAYQSVFFAEEERRIEPALRGGLANAQEMAAGLSLPALIEELSQGVHFDEDDFRLPEVILAPTYWSTPLVFFDKNPARRLILLFGVRPADASLVPGKQVPDALLQALKALADPTRLRILRYLSRETLTPTALARRLRLRAPTLTHHLSALRLAGLVRLDLQVGGEKRYTARPEGLRSTLVNLTQFLDAPEPLPEETEEE